MNERLCTETYVEYVYSEKGQFLVVSGSYDPILPPQPRKVRQHQGELLRLKKLPGDFETAV